MIALRDDKQTVAKYLLVQYMDDVRRRETRNIGVIVWTPGAAECRFVSDVSAKKIVKDVHNFNRWVAFWNKRVGSPILSHHGQSASIESDEYFDLLMSTQNGNFTLVDAGESLDAIQSSQIDDFADFLFEELVDERSPSHKTDERVQNLRERCTAVFDMIGIRHDQRLRHNEMVDLIIDSHSFPCKFDYVWGDGRYEALMQRVLLKEQKSVLSAYTMQRQVEVSKVNSDCKRVAIVNSTEIDNADRQIQMLSHAGSVIDLKDIDAAAGMFTKTLNV